MREILFRGKRMEDGIWIEGFLILNTANHPLIGKPFFSVKKVIPETVGQFTGLTDKNGKKIFEGDLCLCNRNINSGVDKQVFHINFDTEYGQWVGDSWSSNITADEFFMCEIIGNIHDNPELRDGK